ncbi:MAG TPA: Scr1 family TA system antitoxin-like transcriptional regulator [Candidatus Saccharimonadales bacterium]|nr:Scr1 family TA system antitoxin-like transcriptional regulator [Candidatus Saccharimonadales bacterium]
MATNRQELIARSAEIGTPDIDNARAFFEADERAVRFEEYMYGAVPTYLQTPAVARAYVKAFLPDVTPEQLDYAVDSRRILERDARRRCNKGNHLYVSQYSLELSSVAFLKEGIMQRRKLALSHSQRQEQLARIATKSADPHLDIRVVPDHCEQPPFENAMLYNFEDGKKVVFHEGQEGLAPPVTDPEQLATFEQGFAHLAQIALQPNDSLLYVEAVIRRNSASIAHR